MRLCRRPARKGFAFPASDPMIRGYASIRRRSLLFLTDLNGEASLTAVCGGRATDTLLTLLLQLTHNRIRIINLAQGFEHAAHVDGNCAVDCTVEIEISGQRLNV